MKNFSLMVFAAVAVLFLFPMEVAAYADDLIPDDLIPIDAVLVLDVSRSMRTADPDRVSRDAMNLFIRMLTEERDRVGVVAYAGNVERSLGIHEINSPDDREFLREFIDGLEYASWTDHGVGLREAIEILSASENELHESVDTINTTDATEARQGIIIFLTDGNMNVSPHIERTNELAQDDVNYAIYAARARNIPIHAIGLNFDGNLDMVAVETVARETGGLAFETADAADIYAIVRAFFNAMIAAPQIETEESIAYEPEPELGPEPMPAEFSENPYEEPAPELDSAPDSDPEPYEEQDTPAQNVLGVVIATGLAVFLGGAAFFLIKKPRRVFTGKLQIETSQKSITKNLIEFGNRVSLGTLLQSDCRELHDVILSPSPHTPSHLPQLRIVCKNSHVKFTKDFLPQDISRGTALTIGSESTIETKSEVIKLKYTP